MTKHGLDAPDELTDGSWQPLGGILVWTPRDLVAALPSPSLLIACPTCHARTDQTCRTRSGHTRTPHVSRLAPRLCICGVLLRARRRFCDPCRDGALQESKNAHGRRRRESARSVA